MPNKRTSQRGKLAPNTKRDCNSVGECNVTSNCATETHNTTYGCAQATSDNGAQNNHSEMMIGREPKEEAAGKYPLLEEQFAETMMRSGVSITVTSLTDFLAFAIGGTTSIPALKSFCMYCGLGIVQ